MEVHMLIKGVDLGKYIESHDPRVVSSFVQFLDVFDCCRNLRKYLKELEADRLDVAREEAEMLRNSRKEHLGYDREGRRGTHKEHIDAISVDPRPPDTIVGVCHKCQSVVRGEPIKGCETEKTGRVFYGMCDRCTYYFEVFKIGRNKYKEVEGG
jgi:hypothetical protein